MHDDLNQVQAQARPFSLGREAGEGLKQPVPVLPYKLNSKVVGNYDVN